jgi:HSP20 family protein
MALTDIPRREPRQEIGWRGDPFNHLRSQINRVFDDAFGTTNRGVGNGHSFAPQIDVTETDSEVKVCAELPGIEAKELDVNVTDALLTIRGEKRTEHTSEETGRHWTERTFGFFERTIPLPAEVDADRAESEFRRGVLRITLPKREETSSRSKKINVA